ncbi:MAG: thiamine pyrophosphate-binding protein [Clostridiaceae bacterium]|nr:thiamine pyrophosphate-binding protein [Clostridiaceae bacterium]
MSIRVADFIANTLVEHGITQLFMITGGGAMHLNDALGKHPGISTLFNHHEQACAIAAEGYARVTGVPAAVCVTTGPGGTNAITGVLGAWLDSIPMIVISGQVRYDTTARSTGLPLRAVGDQEFDITKATGCMTKYAVMVVDPQSIKYHLERAIFLSTAGRPGPVWLDIPLNVQSSLIEPAELPGYDWHEDGGEVPPQPSQKIIADVVGRLKQAKRPVLYLGSAIPQNHLQEAVKSLAKQLKIPVVTAWNGIDAMESDNPYYIGRPGNLGDRPGNFAVQNSDLILSLGCRLSIRQVGFNWKAWARCAYKIVVDIDPVELKKPTVQPDMPIHADIRDFIPALAKALAETDIGDKSDWLQWTVERKNRYPVVCCEYWNKQKPVNPYCYTDLLTRLLPAGEIVITGNGTSCVVTSHCAIVKKGTRVIINSGAASMGYDLPAAIGGCLGNHRKPVICLSGDGSIQMNIQELQTIVHHQLPIKIFVVNNHGYHSIRQTQSNYFGRPLVGVDEESGISFPDLGKLCAAYGLAYRKIETHEHMESQLNEVIALDKPVLCEVIVDIDQPFAPKSSAKKLPDGRMVSAPLEELWPFLPDEELMDNMLVEPCREE